MSRRSASLATASPTLGKTLGCSWYGAVVHAARQARMAFNEMRERLDVARETYGVAREEGQFPTQ